MVKLVKAELEDLESIANLAKQIWNIHYPPIIGQAQVDYMLERFYNYNSLIKQQQEGQVFYLIQIDDQNLGFIAVSKKEDDYYFIHKFYIDPTVQGKGLGEKAFENLKKIYLKSQLIHKIELTVNRQNYKAINFYFKLGFKIKDIADFDIENGYKMNDFIMEWKGNI